jgi:hypothetical protein
MSNMTSSVNPSTPQIDSKLEQEIDLYFLRIRDISHHLDFDVDEFPKNKHIYHYTTASGLLGILQSQTIWATETSYLNDSQEVKYGVDLALGELTKLSEENNAKGEREFIRVVSQDLQTFGTHEFFVSCFCEDGDLLSQWKGYSDFGAGFSIGLDIENYSNSLTMLSNSPIRIKKVVYEPEIQKRILWDEFIATLGVFDDWIERYPSNKTNIIMAAAVGLVAYIKLQLVRFKAPAFSEEQEWRIIYYPLIQSVSEYKKLIKFRTAENRIIPYLEFPFPTSSKIIMGPKIDRESARKAINLISHSATHRPEVSESKISFQ